MSRRKSDLGAARAPNALGLLENHEADWMLQRTLAYMNVNAAEIGEVRTIAQRIDERDPESWPTCWAEVAELVEAHGDKALADGDPVSARQSLLRASNYSSMSSPCHPTGRVSRRSPGRWSRCSSRPRCSSTSRGPS